jgi:hypothetical protein
MNTVIIVWVIIVTLTFVTLVAFAVRTLMQVFRTAKQAELLLVAINQEANVLSHIMSSVGSFFKQSFPIIKIGSVVSGLVAGWFAKRKKT